MTTLQAEGGDRSSLQRCSLADLCWKYKGSTLIQGVDIGKRYISVRMFNEPFRIACINIK